MRRVRRSRGPVVDFAGREIKPGDLYFYGSPPTMGKVVKIMGRSLMLDIGVCRWTGANATMNCRSPHRGIVLCESCSSFPS